MTDKEKARLAMLVMCGQQRRLSEDEIAALGIPVDPNATFSDLHLAEGDHSWRTEVVGGPLHGQPMKFHPDEIKERAVDLLLSVLFPEKKKVVAPRLPPTKITNRRKR